MSLLPEWGATLVREGYRSHKLFQSTLPVWGATRGSAGAALRPTDFNPRFPSGERRGHHQDHPRDLWISIHAPRVGSDLGGPGGRGICPISIHAPRVGSDFSTPSMVRRRANFNPRSPCGERPERSHPDKGPSANFNPRSPCGERLPVSRLPHLPQEISIHAPRVGSDCQPLFISFLLLISIHAPRVGSDMVQMALEFFLSLFQSTLPVWGATARCSGPTSGARHFNPRSPCGERRSSFLQNAP